MNEFVPGDPINEIANDSESLIASILGPIQEAENVIEETDAAIVVPIIESITQAETICEKATAICTGEIAVQIDAAESTVKKLYKKIRTQLTDYLSDAYMYMGQVGIPIPTDDEVIASDVIPPSLSYPAVPADVPESDIPIRSEIPPSGIAPCPGINPATGLPWPLGTWGTEACGNSGGPGPGSPPPIVPGNGTQFPSPCPPGFIAGGSADWHTEYTTLVGSTGRDLPVNPQPCDPQVTGGWVMYFHDTDNIFPEGPGTIPPWYTEFPIPENYNYSQVCIPSCHLPPTAQRPFCLYIPAGWGLYINNKTGQVIASDHAIPGYTPIGIIDQLPPGLPNSPPGAGQCVPAPQPGEVCPSQPNLTCGPDANFGGLPKIPKEEDVCKLIEEGIHEFATGGIDLNKLLGMKTATSEGSTLGSAIAYAIGGSKNPLIPSMFNRFIKWANGAITEASNSLNCTHPALAPLNLIHGMLKFIDHWAEIIPDQLLRSVDQISNTICQSKLPSGSEADESFLADVINDETWKCWHRAEGNHLDPARNVLDSKRTRPTAQQIDLLWRRKYIEEQEYKDATRQLGVIKDDDRIRIHNLNDEWPTVSDLVPMMQRDVFDNEAVARGKLDEDFDKKFQGKAKDYAEALGVSEELMKFHWRKHWHIPSYTMGREFVHRFNNPELPENLRFTEEDFKEMLKMDDWAPGYIDRMIAATYHEINLTDALRAYMIHVSSDEEFQKQLTRIGYSKANAEFMQRYHKKRRTIADRKAAGYPLFRTIIGTYGRCELTDGQLNGYVEKIAIDDDQKKAAFEAASLSREVWERKQTIRTVKRPFIQGLYDHAQAIQELQKSNVDPDCIASFLSMWERERLKKGKQLTADQLCDMYAKGIIDGQTFLLALVRVGWDEEDAALLVIRCGAKISEAEERKAKAEERRREAERRRLLKEAEKAKRLAECGPVPCPANRNRNNPPSGGGQ